MAIAGGYAATQSAESVTIEAPPEAAL
jgi:hypothetical protein